LTDWYYSTIAPSVLKENTAYDNMLLLNLYVMPRIANKKLKDITPVLLDDMFMEIRKSGRTKVCYRLKDLTQIPPHGKRAIFAADVGIGRVTIVTVMKGGNVWREVAEKYAAGFGQPLDAMFERVPDNRELAPATISKIRRSMSAIFQTAVRKEIITRNPISHTTPPKTSKQATSFLDETQANLLMSALEKQPDFQFRTAISLLLFTGMRGGELCALLWANVDLENGVIYIRHTLAANKAKNPQYGNFYLQSPKTETGERYVMIPPAMVALLIEHKRRQEERQAAMGSEWATRGMVFTNTKGDYYNENGLNHKFKTFAAKLGLPPEIHIHSLRHTNASLLINADVSARVIAEQLGHKNTSVTENIYSHVFQSSRVKAMQALELKLGKAAESE